MTRLQARRLLDELRRQIRGITQSTAARAHHYGMVRWWCERGWTKTFRIKTLDRRRHRSFGETPPQLIDCYHKVVTATLAGGEDIYEVYLELWHEKNTKTA